MADTSDDRDRPDTDTPGTDDKTINDPVTHSERTPPTKSSRA